MLFFNFSETFFLKCTCTRTHDNINLFLRETRNIENRNPNITLKMNRTFHVSHLHTTKEFGFVHLQKGE
jgi:hypothetical protein